MITVTLWMMCAGTQEDSVLLPYRCGTWH